MCVKFVWSILHGLDMFTCTHLAFITTYDVGKWLSPYYRWNKPSAILLASHRVNIQFQTLCNNLFLLPIVL